MSALLDLLHTTQAVAAFVGLVVLLLLESAHPFFEFFRERGERRQHLIRNLALGLVNGLLVAVFFAGVWVLAAEWAGRREIGLLRLGELPLWLHAVLAVLLLDVWTYTWHRLNHRIPFLWRFHRVHHADAHMDVTTASRFHTGEIVLSSILRVPLIIGLGVHAWELVLYETLMFAVVQFHHANLALPPAVDRALRTVIVTPAMHKVHHSRWQPETDSNYSSLFSWWDRVFRSFRHREALHEIHLGLDQFDGEETLGGLLKMPLAPHRRATDEPDGQAHAPAPEAR